MNIMINDRAPPFRRCLRLLISTNNSRVYRTDASPTPVTAIAVFLSQPFCSDLLSAHRPKTPRAVFTGPFDFDGCFGEQIRVF